VTLTPIAAVRAFLCVQLVACIDLRKHRNSPSTLTYVIENSIDMPHLRGYKKDRFDAQRRKSQEAP
jgi:hypothetical protein